MKDSMMAAPQEGFPEEMRPQRIPFSRRKELLELALSLTETAMNKTQPHELCLLRQMVDALIDRR